VEVEEGCSGGAVSLLRLSCADLQGGRAADLLGIVVRSRPVDGGCWSVVCWRLRLLRTGLEKRGPGGAQVRGERARPAGEEKGIRPCGVRLSLLHSQGKRRPEERGLGESGCCCGRPDGDGEYGKRVSLVVLPAIGWRGGEGSAAKAGDGPVMVEAVDGEGGAAAV